MDEKLARGLQRQLQRTMAPHSRAARVDGLGFCLGMMEASMRARRADKATFNVRLAAHLKRMSGNLACIEAAHQRMALSRTGRMQQRHVHVDAMTCRRPDGTTYETREWTFGATDFRVTGGLIEGSAWTCPAIVSPHLIERHMARTFGQRAEEAALRAADAALPLALLYRLCASMEAPGTAWDIAVPVRGGVALGGTTTVESMDISNEIHFDPSRWDTGVGMSCPEEDSHSVASLRTFIVEADLPPNRAATMGRISAWAAANQARLASSMRETYASHEGDMAESRLDLARSFRPLALEAQDAFSRWRQAYGAAGRPACAGEANANGAAQRLRVAAE